jgi:AbiV family abortive infection protein
MQLHRVLMTEMSAFPIPWSEALEGCKLSIENAMRLAEDAQLLKDSGKDTSAFAASLNAWEELGKAVLLFRYWKLKQDITENEWFKILCDHRRKRVAYVESMDVLYGSVPPKDIAHMKGDLTMKSKEWGELFDYERAVGVYVDWVGKWRSPSRIAGFGYAFDSGYWISSVELGSMHIQELLPK